MCITYFYQFHRKTNHTLTIVKSISRSPFISISPITHNPYNLMSKSSESGQAKTVANFESLISFCTAYGAPYNPSKASLKTVAMTAQLATTSSKQYLQIQYKPFSFSNSNAERYYDIQSFGSKETEKVWQGTLSSKLPIDVQKIGRRKLRMLNNSFTLNDLRVPPANRLEKLSGDLRDYHSIRINDQWRIIFKWIDGHSHEVEIIDYH